MGMDRLKGDCCILSFGFPEMHIILGPEFFPKAKGGTRIFPRRRRGGAEFFCLCKGGGDQKNWRLAITEKMIAPSGQTSCIASILKFITACPPLSFHKRNMIPFRSDRFCKHTHDHSFNFICWETSVGVSTAIHALLSMTRNPIHFTSALPMQWGFLHDTHWPSSNSMMIIGKHAHGPINDLRS